MTLRLRKGGKNNLFMQLLVLAYLVVSIQIVLFAFRLSAYQYLGPILPLVKPWAAWAGITLTIVPGAFAWFAQNHLGLSWRLGIDESSENVMKSEGLYRLVRHPIYSAMILIGVDSRNHLAGSAGGGNRGIDSGARAGRVAALLQPAHLRRGHGGLAAELRISISDRAVAAAGNPDRCILVGNRTGGNRGSRIIGRGARI